MIRDPEAIKKEICTWLSNYAIKHNKTNFIVNVDEDPSSLLTAYLCSHANSYNNNVNSTKTKTVGIFLFNDFSTYPIRETFKKICRVETIAYKGNILLSLAHYASENNGIVVGDTNRTNGLLSRDYKKFELWGGADIFPIFELYQSEVEQLTKLWLSEFSFKQFEDISQLEWACRENDINGIIVNDVLPSSLPYWYKYTLAQKQIISTLHAREKATRHKSIEHKPHCKLRHLAGVFDG